MPLVLTGIRSNAAPAVLVWYVIRKERILKILDVFVQTSAVLIHRCWSVGFGIGAVETAERIHDKLPSSLEEV